MKLPIKNLYYYTTVDTMRYILKDANIFATDLNYMNDSEEYINGLCELREVINSNYGDGRKQYITEDMLNAAREEPSEIYSISFSTQRDLLSQWSMYAKESGVSLKMDFSSSHEYLAYPFGEKNEERKTISQILYPKEVYYFTKHAMDIRQYRKVERKIIEDIEKHYGDVCVKDMEANALTIWQETTPYVKRYEFNAEGEYRLAFNARNFATRFRIDYRNDKNVLKPYLDVKCAGGWPIKEIIVGPGFNQQAVYDSIIHFVQHAQLEIAKLNKREFGKQCEAVLTYRNNIPELAKKLWCAVKSEIMETESDRHDKFNNLRKQLLSSVDLEQPYKDILANRFLSKDGLIISKSEIPYIY